MTNYIDKPLSELEVAAMLNISVETVKRTEKAALAKMKQSAEFMEIKENYGEDKIVEDTSQGFEDYKIHR